MRLGQELKRLGRHSAVYGLGGLVSRILATLLLPLYTHYLPPGSYGRVELVTAATAVLAIVLQLGISSAFFRFYFDAKEDAERLVVIRTSFWFTMAMSTLGLLLGVVFAAPVGHWIGLGHDPNLVRAAAVGLWAQTNYQQLTALFRVEERSVQYAIASVGNVLITVVAMVLFVAYFHWGAVGLVVGNFTGTLLVYAVLLAYRHEHHGAQFDTGLFRKMQPVSNTQLRAHETGA
jgi:O-antigen/teichoic acid export membrane protein